MVLYLYVFIIKVPPPKVRYVINKKKKKKTNKYQFISNWYNNL